MRTIYQSTESPYEAALAEERLMWKRLDMPLDDVNERIKACAAWSAAADRARAAALRTQAAPAATTHE